MPARELGDDAFRNERLAESDLVGHQDALGALAPNAFEQADHTAHGGLLKFGQVLKLVFAYLGEQPARHARLVSSGLALEQLLRPMS